MSLHKVNEPKQSQNQYGYKGDQNGTSGGAVIRNHEGNVKKGAEPSDVKAMAGHHI